MKLYLGFPIYLVLAALVFQAKGEEVIIEEPVGETGNNEKVPTLEVSSIDGVVVASEGPVIEVATIAPESVPIDGATITPDGANIEGATLVPEGPVIEAANLGPEGEVVYEAAKDQVANVDVTTVDGANIDGSATNEAYVINCLYERPDCFCLDYVQPVCAINGCTYRNNCRRVCAEVELAHTGPCHDHLDDLEDDE